MMQQSMISERYIFVGIIHVLPFLPKQLGAKGAKRLAGS